MSDVPTEIYHEILRRVPVESLLKVRSVCKSWRRIIDDPAFAKLHTHREDWFIMKPYYSGKIYLFPLKEMVFEKIPSVNRVLGTNVKNLVGRGVPHIRAIPAPSCNGLILISSCNKNMFWRIWNPFTGESLQLGHCDEFEKVKCVDTDIPYSGIGYDEANDDYKVVRIDQFRTFIYSMNLKEWHRIEDFPFPNSHILDKNGIFAYGALHWVASSEGENKRLGIAALDLSTEKYLKIEVPSEIEELTVYGPGPRLVSLSECLFISIHSSNYQLSVWMIKRHGCENTWVKMVSMEGKLHWSPIAYLKSKEWILLRHDNQNCCWYDLVNKCTVRMRMEIIPQIDDLGKNHFYGQFHCQVIPASLVRLMESDETSKRKRKRTMANKRLEMKIIFGDDEDRSD